MVQKLPFSDLDSGPKYGDTTEIVLLFAPKKFKKQSAVSTDPLN